MKNYFLTILTFLFFQGLAQDATIGLISYDITQSYQGYTLIYPHNQSSVFLLNNCGEIVNEWTDEADFRPGNTAYLLDDGSIIKSKRPSDISGDAIWAGGGGAIIEKRSWDNDLLWSYEMNNEERRLHHDFAVTPNGNVLMLAWELKTNEEARAAGRDTALLSQEVLWPDFIQEVNPSNDEVVWEWHVWDHLIQDYDSTAANYGVVSENPGKINLNYDTNDGRSDWMHTNALDYNPTLKQIMISVPTFSELWIIDHTTSTAQAKTSRGGFTNHGGDIIYRIGNSSAYDRADAGEQLLFYQHDTHWTNEFLPAAHPDAGKIVCFNNRNPGGYSSVEIIEAPWNMYISDYDMFQGSFPPYETDQTILHPDTFAITSTGLSSAQILPNGNMLICSGRHGYLVELTPNNDIVWEYITPTIKTNRATQGDTLVLNDNLTFRAFRYPPDYSAFEGKDLSMKGFIELSPIEDWCERLTFTSTPEEPISLIFPNPATDRVHISWDSGKIIDIAIYDLSGKLLLTEKGNGGMKYLDISSLNSGIYLLTIDGRSAKRLIKY